MSIERTPRGEWRVRWREAGRNRSKLIGKKKDAVNFEAELKRAKRLGTLAHLEMGNDPFGSSESGFVADWWHGHGAKKAPKTQTLYAYLLDKYLVPRFGGHMLAEITVAEVEAWLGDLEQAKVGRVAQQKALALLTQILNAAIRWGKLAQNPATLAARPSHRRKPIRPPSPAEVEEIRLRLLTAGRDGDAVLVSVLAYAGLRPQEALSLRWSDVGERTILVGHETKTGSRSVRLLAPLAKDLAEWKLSTGQPFELCFPNTRGERFSEVGWSNWRRRVWAGVAPEGMTPYALRHAFISLLIREGLSVVEIAAQAGHSPAVCLATYAHTWEELRGRGSAEDAIRVARAELIEERKAQ